MPKVHSLAALEGMSSPMIQRVLITGGFGYLGGRIAVALTREAGFNIRLASRESHSRPTWLPEAEPVRIDLLNPETTPDVMRGIDAVVHLAAMNENDCVKDPSRALLVNGLGTHNILQAAIHAGVQRFVYFSTAHVYGAPLAGHITERTLPRPVHPYAITHHAAEDFVLAANDQGRITGIVVRLSNGIGAPTHPDVNRWTLLVNDLALQVAQTGRIVLRSDGLQRRDFVTLADVGRATGHLLGLDQGVIGDGLFNLGGEASLTVWEMAQRVAARACAINGITPRIERPEPGPEASAPDLMYDAGKLKATGFRLTGDIDGEIDNTLLMAVNGKV